MSAQAPADTEALAEVMYESATGCRWFLASKHSRTVWISRARAVQKAGYVRTTSECGECPGCYHSGPCSRSSRITGIELHCDDCQQPYAVWFAENDVWNLVVGGPGMKDDPGGMLCPRCFTLRAASVYVNPRWSLHLVVRGAP